MNTLASYGAVISSFVCASTALHLFLSPTRFRRPQWLLAVFFGLFAVQLALTAVQILTPNVMLGRAKVVAVLLLLPVGYLFCQTLARRPFGSFTQQDSAHLIPAFAGLSFGFFQWGLLLDTLVILTEAVYALLLLRLLVPGRSAIDLPRRFQLKSFRWVQFFLALYGISLISDIVIATQASNEQGIGGSLFFFLSMVAIFAAAIFVSLRAMGENSIFAWLGDGLPPKTIEPSALSLP